MAVGSFESEAEDPKKKEVMARTLKLEQTSQRNFDWQFEFKHRSLAWRDEVRREG